MTSPAASVPDWQRLRLMDAALSGRPRIVLDTDTDNEIDDQFAVVHAALATDRIDLQAVYAAPFANARMPSPREGMERSLAEIGRVLDLLPGARPEVRRGSERWCSDRPGTSAAAADLVERSRSADGAPLTVVAIGAPTNVANAFRLDPGTVERIAVVWLGGNPSWMPHEPEFNASQDLAATAALFDSGVALTVVPCRSVAEQLRTTHAEVDRHVRPTSAVGGYLAEIFDAHHPEEPGWSKPIWDLAATARVLDPTWTTSHLEPAPLVAPDGRWLRGETARHLVRVVDTVDRDAVFGDLVQRLAGASGPDHPPG